MFKKLFLTSLFAGFTTHTAFSAAVFVDNFSFEDDVTPDGTFPVGPSLPSGWDTYDPDGVMNNAGNYRGVVNPNEDFFTTDYGDVPAGHNVPHGVNAAITWMNGADSSVAGLSQTLTETLQANTTYTLSVGVGNIGSGYGSADPTFYWDLDGFPGYSVELWAGNQMLAQDYNTLVIDERQWLTSTIQYTSGAVVTPAQNLEIRLINLNLDDPAGPGIEVDFDNVLLDATPVPEPNAILLSTLSLLTLLTRRTRSIS